MFIVTINLVLKKVRPIAFWLKDDRYIKKEKGRLESLTEKYGLSPL